MRSATIVQRRESLNLDQYAIRKISTMRTRAVWLQPLPLQAVPSLAAHLAIHRGMEEQCDIEN